MTRPTPATWPPTVEVRSAIEFLVRIANLEYAARHGDEATRERAKRELEAVK